MPDEEVLTNQLKKLIFGAHFSDNFYEKNQITYLLLTRFRAVLMNSKKHAFFLHLQFYFREYLIGSIVYAIK